MKRIIFISLALMLTGCASVNTDDACTRTEFRQEGMLLNKNRCTEWSFGPSKAQTALFERRNPELSRASQDAERERAIIEVFTRNSK